MCHEWANGDQPDDPPGFLRPEYWGELSVPCAPLETEFCKNFADYILPSTRNSDIGGLPRSNGWGAVFADQWWPWPFLDRPLEIQFPKKPLSLDGVELSVAVRLKSLVIGPFPGSYPTG